MKNVETDTMVWYIGNGEVEEFLTMAHNCQINVLGLEAKEGEQVSELYGMHTLGKNTIAIRVEVPEDKVQYFVFGYGWMAAHGWEAEYMGVEMKPDTSPADRLPDTRPPTEYLQ